MALLAIFGVVYLLTSINNNYFNILPEKCGEKVSASGNCAAMPRGYQYNKKKNECEVIHGSGCSINTPFETMEDCQKKCKKLKFHLF